MLAGLVVMSMKQAPGRRVPASPSAVTVRMAPAVMPRVTEPPAADSMVLPPDSTVEDAQPQPSTGQADTQARPEEAAPQPPAPSGSAQAGPTLNEDDYLPRSALTQGPQASAEVPLRWPAGEPPGQRQVARYRLFIDDTGRVRRLHLVGGYLGPAFAQMALQAFAETPFSPGRQGELPVRCWILIEIEFDDRGTARAQWLP
ncbi:MAG TPA: energy transducer TonB [Burkholderiaceae bacterium]|nr:energy transducer TonB [Burkholderiaceae bacterium]